jgi:hypothetical protein
VVGDWGAFEGDFYVENLAIGDGCVVAGQDGGDGVL